MSAVTFPVALQTLSNFNVLKSAEESKKKMLVFWKVLFLAVFGYNSDKFLTFLKISTDFIFLDNYEENDKRHNKL